MARRNRQRAAAVQAERAHLKPLLPRRTTDFTEIVVPVTRTGGFLVKSIFYSAPSQLIGQRLRVHLYDDRIEAFLGSTLIVSHPRARGRGDGHRVHVINYHHVIHALRRKPQALWSSIYRDSLFQSGPQWHKCRQVGLPNPSSTPPLMARAMRAASRVQGPAGGAWRRQSASSTPGAPALP